MSVGCVGFEDFSIVAFDDAGHVVHTTVAISLMLLRLKILRVFLREVFVNQ